jgi:coiled-coil domain-containing protein 61
VSAKSLTAIVMISHNGRDYEISLKYTSTQCTIILDSQHHQYQGIYTPGYIEQITTKTGNFKSFKIFMEMLDEAIHSPSTRLKLELVEAKQLGLKSDKLYLVLTYAVAYDRIHYPLPLQSNERLEPIDHERTDTLSQLSKLTVENDQLRHLLKQATPLTPLKLQDLFKRVESIEERLERVVSQSDLRQMVSKFKNVLVDFRGYKVVKSEPLGVKNRSNTRDSYGSQKTIPKSASRDREKATKPSRTTSKTPTRPTARPTSRPTARTNSRPTSRDSRTSPKPFKRFDPTDYIKQRNEKRRYFDFMVVSLLIV